MEDQILRFDSKLALIDTEDEHRRTSWGLISCWSAVFQIEHVTATKFDGLHSADYKQAIPSEIEQSAPAVPGVLKRGHSAVDNFSVSGKWLIDTGCAHDIVPDSKAADHPTCLLHETPQACSTVDGDTASTVRMHVNIPAIDCKTSPCLLPDTPAVLTVGGSTELGYSFIWLANKTTCWILPSGHIVPLSVQQHVPYLCEGGPHTDSNHVVERYCGITTCGHEVRFNIGATPALPAVESLSVGGASAADTSNPFANDM